MLDHVFNHNVREWKMYHRFFLGEGSCYDFSAFLV
jgi:hypothetical protein